MSHCPTCKKPTNSVFAPFCSQRCQQIDLLRWMNESYRVPSVETPFPSEESDENEKN